MSVTRRYAIGLGVVGAGGLVAGLCAGPDRAAVWTAVAIALGLQGPLGWWLVRTIGGPMFFPAWGAGLLGRLGLVALTALVLLASQSPQTTAVLVALAGALVALLGVEIVVLLGERLPREDV